MTRAGPDGPPSDTSATAQGSPHEEVNGPACAGLDRRRLHPVRRRPRRRGRGEGRQLSDVRVRRSRGVPGVADEGGVEVLRQRRAGQPHRHVRHPAQPRRRLRVPDQLPDRDPPAERRRRPGARDPVDGSAVGDLDRARRGLDRDPADRDGPRAGARVGPQPRRDGRDRTRWQLGGLRRHGDERRRPRQRSTACGHANAAARRAVLVHGGWVRQLHAALAVPPHPRTEDDAA